MNKSQFSQIEEEMLKSWEQENTFQKSLEQRKDAEYFSFYDGPPFANGLPHYGHVVPGTIKDAVARYKTMRGYYVPRKAGWDTHGLPVEYDVEKQLKLSGKKQILELGVDKFNQACRDSVFRYKAEFESFIKRMGRWLDLENPYATLDDSYIESVWWVVSELHKKELLYQGVRSMPYCPRCATPLSNFELNQGYQDNVEDPSFFITFPLSDGRQLLAWTTTPWSLGGNTAVAVNPKEQYVTVELLADDGADEQLVLAEKRLKVLNQQYKVLKKESGQALIGQAYEPIYELDPDVYKQVTNPNIYKVWGADFASVEEGTGVVHVAPATGVDDLALSHKHDIPVIHAVDENGNLLGGIGFDEIQGQFFKEADRAIIEELTKRGRVYAAETLKHTYPFCWRCDTPLMYYATPTWNVAVTKLAKDLLTNNEKINWIPSHIKDGRFGNWLADARDWGISRNRFWGAPLPIWVNEADKDDRIVIGSIQELKQLSGAKDFDMHRPGIDNVVIKREGKTYRRVSEVLDCWFESGAMPYGQAHYPFENEASFKKGFPADFISEGLDQTRGWFYTLHVLGTALFNKPTYKNVICHGIVVAADGKKLSKRLRNYPPLDEVFDNYGVDCLRFFMLNSPVVSGEEVRFSADHLKDTQRNVFLTWWNVYSFFKTYADIDKWQPAAKLQPPLPKNILDKWILARLNQTIAEVTAQADKYHLARATRPIVELIEDLSNWYVRRSRRRFWKSEDDGDKQAAYETLYWVLLRLSQLMAPWAPFLSDKIYRELRTDGMPNSVHLTDWPETGKFDQQILSGMKQARAVIAEGLSQRAQAGIKVRQPLASVFTAEIEEDYEEIIKEELNVKEISPSASPSPSPEDNEQPSMRDLVQLNTKLTHELQLEGLAREVIRHVQAYRKELALQVDDRIHLSLQTGDDELKESLEAFSDLVAAETLATKLDFVARGDPPAGRKPVDITGKKLEIAITKAASN